MLGSNNIAIGNPGVAADGIEDNGEIRIGTNQSNTYIAGIWNGTPNGDNRPVCVDANGVLGTNGCGLEVGLLLGPQGLHGANGEVTNMGDSSDRLFQLHPVTLFAKPGNDESPYAPQYGLLAEEVVKIYPEMVDYDKEGRPISIKYHALAAMLLNEVQKQNAQLQKLDAERQIQRDQDRSEEH